LGRKNEQGIPTNAILLQLLFVNLLLLTQSFQDVVRYTQFSLLLCSLLAVLGVIVLRFTRPEITRPYRVWLYPIPPVVFSIITVCAQENPKVAPRAIPVKTGPNEVARFLAGMPVAENSPLAPLTRDPAWQAHAAFFEEQFAKLHLRQLQKLHAWQQTSFAESLK